MAVSFKVPKSPKKSIFVIDEFQGVDLTNTGSNIDETRSPNAVNMVRYVPGKVRKRTGYQSKVVFGEIVNVNRAANTSNTYVRVDVTATSYATRNTFCKLYDEYEGPNFFCTIRGKGTYSMGWQKVDGSGKGITSFTLDEEHPEKDAWYFNWATPQLVDSLYIYKTSEDPEDYLEIKNVRVYAETTATTLDEWKALPWTQAPEDKGIIYVKETSKPAIFGCHPIKSGSFTGNRVVNVNRAANTSNTFQTFTCDDSNWTVITDTYDFIYETEPYAQTTKIFTDFDYISDSEVLLLVGGWYSSWNILQDTSGNIQHYFKQEKAGSFIDRRVAIKAVSGTATVQIKNLSVCYEKDSSYSWTPAPEDLNREFNIEDTYYVGSKNYAVVDHAGGTITSTSLFGHIGFDVTNATSNVEGFSKISFDLYTTSSQKIDYIKVETANDQGGLSGIKKYFYSDVNSEHVEFYLSAGEPPRYTKTIWVDVYFKTTDGTSTVRISNVQVQSIKGRDTYEISQKYYIYHAGRKFYLRASNATKLTEIYSLANQHISKSWQLNEKLFILDGRNIYSYSVGDDTVKVLSAGDGYIPLVTISKLPDGGGTTYEALNMLQPGFYEQFLVQSADATKTAFHLSFSGLDDTKTKAWLLDNNGNWVEKTEGVHYTVDRASGIITFTTAPGVTPLTGEDNVKILAYRTVPDYADRISKCTVGTLFGVGGAADRLFLSGNPDHPNWDFYSEQYDPTYFPDTGYSQLGSAASSIVGYAIINNYLATFKDDFDTSQAVFIREGDLVKRTVTTSGGANVEVSDPAFKLINTLQGNGVVAPYSFGYLQTEPLFLTKSGIYAITAQDITGEKYSQNRSFYLDGFLREEDHMENAVATVFNDQYVLALNNKFYILDGLQATRTDRSEPYATRQYVGFYCTDIPAVSIWTDDQALWIGTNDGRVCRFATEIENLDSYNDDGDPIYCCWETPDLSGKLFYKNKTFRYFAIRMMQALRTSVKMYARKMGTWSFIKEDTRSGIAFDFELVDFERFSFSTDRSERVIHTKIRVKKVDKARFKVENDALNEPFGLFDWALEYIESGNFKG